MLQTLCAPGLSWEVRLRPAGTPAPAHLLLVLPLLSSPSVTCTRNPFSVSASWKPTVLGPCSSYDKSPQREWLKTAGICSLTIVGAGSLTLRWRWSWGFAGSENNPPTSGSGSLSASGSVCNPWCTLACRYLSPIDAPTFARPSPCVSV